MKHFLFNLKYFSFNSWKFLLILSNNLFLDLIFFSASDTSSYPEVGTCIYVFHLSLLFFYSIISLSLSSAFESPPVLSSSSLTFFFSHKHFIHSFPVFMNCIYFSCLIELAKIYSTMLSRSGVDGQVYRETKQFISQ